MTYDICDKGWLSKRVSSSKMMEATHENRLLKFCVRKLGYIILHIWHQLNTKAMCNLWPKNLRGLLFTQGLLILTETVFWSKSDWFLANVNKMSVYLKSSLHWVKSDILSRRPSCSIVTLSATVWSIARLLIASVTTSFVWPLESFHYYFWLILTSLELSNGLPPTRQHPDITCQICYLLSSPALSSCLLSICSGHSQ